MFIKEREIGVQRSQNIVLNHWREPAELSVADLNSNALGEQDKTPPRQTFSEEPQFRNLESHENAESQSKAENKFEQQEARTNQETRANNDHNNSESTIERLFKTLGSENIMGLLSGLSNGGGGAGGGMGGGLDMSTMLNMLGSFNSNKNPTDNRDGGFNFGQLGQFLPQFLPMFLNSGLFGKKGTATNIGRTINLDNYKRVR